MALDNKLKNTKKKLISEKEIDISLNDCSFDTSEERPGISYEIIGTPGNKSDKEK